MPILFDDMSHGIPLPVIRWDYGAPDERHVDLSTMGVAGDRQADSCGDHWEDVRVVRDCDHDLRVGCSRERLATS